MGERSAKVASDGETFHDPAPSPVLPPGDGRPCGAGDARPGCRTFRPAPSRQRPRRGASPARHGAPTSTCRP